MPEWNPFQVALLVGFVGGSLWSLRTVVKNHEIAGVWMVIEKRFWRSLAVGFAIAFVLFGLLAMLLSGLVWVILGIIS
ncbi:MAG: hypothetical protein M0Z94_00350 [Dehalococcoidales bacterium]|nr:hypothetical protein [Dehalococcoidales bacterium]